MKSPPSVIVEKFEEAIVSAAPMRQMVLATLAALPTRWHTMYACRYCYEPPAAVFARKVDAEAWLADKYERDCKRSLDKAMDKGWDIVEVIVGDR